MSKCVLVREGVQEDHHVYPVSGVVERVKMSERYPDVVLTEEDFERVLGLVDACSQQQLLRLYCKVGAAINGDWEVIRASEYPTPLPPVLELSEDDIIDDEDDTSSDTLRKTRPE
jgi:hypothetical protein